VSERSDHNEERAMTGMLEHEMPGLGHNKPSQEDADAIKHAKWSAGRRSALRARARRHL